ncbi:serine/threonine-protein kinase [Sphaerisporangium aureirubrum]|uniref:Serine/threonine-protein kinase n=1 Tax=Sphaerisporangium aureirubrum TaxID=1544736 RepID=A0ABW1NEZ5_9ACTN
MSEVASLSGEDPERLGEYRLAGRLGEGGQGTVFLGVSASGGRVAVKLMKSRLDDERARRRFAGEVEAVRRVAPFCTAQVLDADLYGDRPYIVSEYVEGVSLQRHVTTEGPRTGGAMERIAVGTATALAAIHGAGVVHRDFKPGNVLLGTDGPRVIDFGISRLMDTVTTTGRVPVGTPAYISPEQLKGERAGPAADMFGWALTVAFTASGRHAYAAPSLEAVFGRVLFGEPDLDPLSGPLRELVEECLQPDPGDRPTAEEVLRYLIARRTSAAPPPPPAETRAIDGDTTEDPALVESRVLEAGASLAAQKPPLAEDPSIRTREEAATLPFDGQIDEDSNPPTLTFKLDPVEPDDEDITTTPPIDDDLTTHPAPPRRPRPRWAGRIWALALLVAGTAGIALWLGITAQQDDPSSIFTGKWTGTAAHPSAGQVFPVELDLSRGATAPGSLRWGLDLHCTGTLINNNTTPSSATYRLVQISGSPCYPGTLTLTSTAPDQLIFQVVRQGEKLPRYSGTAVRTP